MNIARLAASFLLSFAFLAIDIQAAAIYSMTADINHPNGIVERDTHANQAYGPHTLDTVSITAGIPALSIPGFNASVDTNLYQKSIAQINSDLYKIEVYTELEAINLPVGTFPAPPNNTAVFTNYASVLIQDQIVVTIPGVSGFGYFSPILALHGQLENGQWPLLRPFIGVQVQVNGQTPIIQGSYGTTFNQTVNQVYDFDADPALRFEYGVPFAFDVNLYSWIFVDESISSNASYTGTARVNFINSLQILSVQILDETGAAVPGAQITSQSGLNYIPTPEPASWLLVSVALAALTVKRARRQS